MKDARHTGGLTGLDPERHHVLDLEINRVTDPNRVPQAVLAHLDRSPLDTEVLAHERTQRLHRAAGRARKHPAELLGLLIRRRSIDEHAQPPVAAVITLGVSATAATVRPLTSVPSISPFLTLKTSVTRQRSRVAPKASDAVHGQTTLHEQVSK